MLRNLMRHGTRMAAAATAVAASAVLTSEKHSTATTESAPLTTADTGFPATQNIVLKDGRRLAFVSVGSGTPVYALHGSGSSHLTWTWSAELLETLSAVGVRLIALDRPGYGDSSNPPAGYSYSAFAADVGELADALGTPKFCVAGHSSGGPYALAAAAVLPERVLACAAISPDAPYAHPAAPADLKQSDAEFSGMLYGRIPAVKFGKWRASDLQKVDRPDKAHAWKGGTIGYQVDFSLERLPYSFKLEDIRLRERLTVWVGENDIEAIKVGSPFIQSLIEGAQLRVVAGGDHGFKSKPEHLKRILIELKKQYEAAIVGVQ